MCVVYIGFQTSTDPGLHSFQLDHEGLTSDFNPKLLPVIYKFELSHVRIVYRRGVGFFVGLELNFKGLQKYGNSGHEQDDKNCIKQTFGFRISGVHL